MSNCCFLVQGGRDFCFRGFCAQGNSLLPDGSCEDSRVVLLRDASAVLCSEITGEAWPLKLSRGRECRIVRRSDKNRRKPSVSAERRQMLLATAYGLEGILEARRPRLAVSEGSRFRTLGLSFGYVHLRSLCRILKRAGIPNIIPFFCRILITRTPE